MTPPAKGSTWERLTEAKARAILRDARQCPHCGGHLSETTLAARHGTSPSTVSRLLSGQHRYSALDIGTDPQWPPASSERVAELRQAVHDGTYEMPPSDVLADAVLNGIRRSAVAA